MYNFSGILFRIWANCGWLLFFGVILLLFKKPWKKTFRIKKCKFELFAIAFAICLGLFYVSRIAFPDVSSYTGEFIDSGHRNGSPSTKEYVFWNGEGKRQVFYLDRRSKKEIFPYEFVSNQKYKIYFDELTDIIVNVEVIE